MHGLLCLRVCFLLLFVSLSICYNWVRQMAAHLSLVLLEVSFIKESFSFLIFLKEKLRNYNIVKIKLIAEVLIVLDCTGIPNIPFL